MPTPISVILGFNRPLGFEPVFDEIALIGQVEEEFEDLLASPFTNPLLEKSRGYFEL